MGKWTRASGLALVVSALVAVSACGSNNPSGFGSPGSGSGGGGSSGGDGDGSVISFGDGSSGSEGGFLGDAGCATASAKATKTPVYIVFVLDGSGSMRDNNKWVAATGALEAIFAEIQKAADPGVGVGLIVFSDTKDETNSQGPYPGPDDVSINFVGAAQDNLLDNRLSGKPSSDTPTGTALKGGYGELTNYVPMTPIPAGGQRVLVLITDGVPTDYCASSGANYTTNLCVEGAAKELALPQPILTFVIGTGVFPSTNLQDFDPGWLGNLAKAGGTGPAGCNPNENTTTSDLCYFEVDPTAGSQAATETAFENALEAIRGQVASCTFPLNVTADAGTLDPSKVNVTVDGMTVPQSATNGWSYNNPTSPTAIVFNGSACTNLKADANANVQIVLGCSTVTAQ